MFHPHTFLLIFFQKNAIQQILPHFDPRAHFYKPYSIQRDR